MENNEIKKKIEKEYLKIRNAEESIEKLRRICKHEKTFRGDYSYRVGACSPAEICEYCGQLIRFIYETTD